MSNKVSDYKIPYRKVKNYFKKTVTPKKVQDTIEKALAFFYEHHSEEFDETTEAIDLDMEL